jgi:uncharacterized repeat protein (TIGR03803 family)
MLVLPVWRYRMKPLALRLLLTCTALALLNACGRSQPDNLPPARPEGGGPATRGIPNRAAFKVLHDFGVGSYQDGVLPLAKLTNLDGVLFGTTEDGGLFTYCSTTGCGTVFSITTAGKEQVVHRFGSTYRDGTNPSADLTNVGGALYGTTQEGGAHNDGTVYSIASGKERVIYSFGTASNDGSGPMGGLVNINGTLYGTTYYGGAHSNGTVFSVTRKGKERVLYSFGQDDKDAVYPDADLLDVHGTLYGTTLVGGEDGEGTVFGVTTTGKERIVHSFGGSSSLRDGSYPYSSLIELNGLLYGTTRSGGAHREGTVFSVSIRGKERIVYSFGADASDGSEPRAGLLSAGRTIYGTTAEGGSGKGCPYARGCGTVFSLDASGGESTLYSFSMAHYAKDGASPGGLISVNGVLYGTASEGGTGNCEFGSVLGCGTVFAVNP